MMLTEFFDEIDELTKIDWKIIKSNQWSDTEEDGDRKRRRQAEFLVHNRFPTNLILGIGVYSDDVKEKVEQMLEESGEEIRVKVIPNWYY